MTSARIGQVRRLIDLLDKERALLISGRFEGIADITAALEKGLDALDTQPDGEVPEALARQLAGRARRNLALTEASQRGLRAATRAIQDRTDGRLQLRTYSQDGGTMVLNAIRRGRDQRS